MRTEAGMTVVELLVAMALASVLATALLGLMTGNVKLFNTDSSRITVGQNLQSSMLMMSNDVRQLGEGLSSSFPSLKVTEDGSGNHAITIRKNVIDTVLPVCDDVKAGSNQDNIPFAEPAKSKQTPTCLDPDNNIAAPWEAYRLAQGGAVEAYIYDPVTQQGEFFTYDAIDSSGFKIHKANDHKWTHSYMAENSPRLYLLEERTYSIVNGQLALQENRGESKPVSPDITQLTVKYLYKNGTTGNGTFPPPPIAGTPGPTWKDVDTLSLTVQGFARVGNQKQVRSMTESISPRNNQAVEQ